MRVKLLIVEDNDAFYEDYFLRLASRLLPMEKVELTRVSSVSAALQAIPEAWDFILMDYRLGPPAEVGEEKVRNGGDLVRYRRRLEEGPRIAPTAIIGMSSDGIGNQIMMEMGATASFSKLDVEPMCKYVKGLMKNG